MVELEIVNGSVIYLNELYIESIEENSDTIIKIHGGTVYVVKQKPGEIMRQITEWNRNQAPCDLALGAPPKPVVSAG